MPGTKWLKFWNYFVLPLLGVIALLMTFHLPRIRYEMLPIAVLCFSVAFGLRERKLWAWRWNWVALVITCLALLVPLRIRAIHADFPDLLAHGASELLAADWDQVDELIGPFAWRLILVCLVWLVPNWLYWTKRKGLFS